MARSRRMELLRRLPPRWQARLLRLGFNWHPAFRATGGRVQAVSPDLGRVVVRLPLKRRTRNILGSLYGGFLFAVTDGVHASMLMAGLKRPVVVWDKSASIRFRRPAYRTVYAEFRITDQDLDAIREQLDRHHETDVTFRVELKDPDGQIYSIVERTLYVADPDHYRQKT